MKAETLQNALQIQKSIDYHTDRINILRNLYGKASAIQISEFGNSTPCVSYSDKRLKHDILHFVLCKEEEILEIRRKEFEAL